MFLKIKFIPSTIHPTSERLFNNVLFRILFSSIFILFSLSVSGEGTRQLMPASTDNGYIQIFDLNTLTRPFASFNCPEENRLNIHICNPGEIIYMGFQQADNDVYFRLKDPTGATVSIAGLVPAAPNTYLLPTAGMGRIANYTQAFNGPSAVVGAGGYNAISYTSTMAGDYYIEFNPTSPTVVTPVKRIFNYFDITVASAANVRIDGRVWSKTWDFTTNGGNNQFKAIMHVYSDDGIVTALNFNGMQPHGFTMSCNATGCTNTGDPAADRVSRFGNSTYAQYKIFLNDPDPTCFLTGSFGNLTAPSTVTGCDDNRCINISVDKPGNIGILLDLNGTAGYQQGTRDRQIFASVVAGTNCIPWDGRDGFGDPVTSGISFQMQVDYFNGITHLPLYDVEHNVNGYIVTLSRPAGPAPRLFWDDAAITTGTSLDGLTNLAGCALATGCHRWQNRGNNSNPETINTWWYANIITENITVDNLTITTDADTRNPGTGSANDTTVCGLLDPIPLFGGVTGATGAIWTTTGTGTFSPDDITLNASYIPSATDIANGFVYLKITSTGNGPCPAVSDSLRMTFQPAPTLSAGDDQVKCANNVATVLNGSFSNAAGITWSSTGGTFVPNATTVNATFTPSAAQITAGSATLTITTNGTGVCPALNDQMTITIEPAPVVNAGSDQSVCANNPLITLAGTVSGATSQSWSGGSGVFNPDNTTPGATYMPTAAEIAAGSVTLTLSADRAGCITVTDQVTITITPAPVVNAGPDQSVCHNNPDVTLNGSVLNPAAYSWSGGTGTFTPDNTSLNAVYTPSIIERDNGTVTLTLTATGTGCIPVTDDMNITITPAPVVDVGADQTVCANNPVLTLAGNSSTGSGVWSNGCGMFVPSPNNLNAQYTPCATEIAAGAAALVLTSTSNGNCNPVSDSLLIVITPAPTANAGADQSVCANNPTLTLAGVTTNASNSTWSGGGGVFNPGSNTPNAQYTPSAAEIASGSVTLTLTASRATCNNVSDQVTITITPAPTVNAGTDRSVCHNNPNVTLNGVVNNAGGGSWSGGLGTFSPSANVLNPTYTPTLAERNGGTVILTLTSTGNGSCNPVNDQMTITITPAPVADAGTDRTVCANNPSLTLNGSVTTATGGTWTGGGTFSPNASALNAVYTPSAAEISAGTAVLTLTTTGNGNCNPVSDQMTVTIIPAPTVNAGTDRNVCADNPVVSLNGSVVTATGGVWTGGAGLFNPNNTALNASYTPTIGEINAGTVTLTLTSTGNGLCNPVSDSMTISISPAPSVNAGADRIVCANTPDVPLSGTVINAGGGTWTTTGSGSFSPNASTLNALYIPSAADRTAGFITLTLTTTGNGLCNAVSDQLTVTFTSVPSINAGANQIVCTNNLPVQLNASGSPATWSGGAGSFSPNANALNATYTPTAGEIASGSVTLTITTIASGACPQVSDQVTITLPPSPIANAGSDATFCGNLNDFALNGSVSNATGGFWSTSGTGSFVPNATTLNATYRPSALDKSNGTVTLTLTTTGNGNCSSHSDDLILTIQPAISADAGPDLSYCENITSYNLNGSVTNALGGVWSTSGSGAFNPNNVTLNATYTPSAGDIASGSVTLTLTTSGNGVCPAQNDQVVFTIREAPSADAGTDQTICADAANIALSGTVSDASGGIWTSSGSGTFSNPVLLNTTYFPSSADNTAGSVTFTLTTTGNGVCAPANDQVTVTINPAPTVNAGTDQVICADAGTVSLNGNVTVATGATWTTSGTGTFNNANLLNAVYTPSATDITNGTVTLTLTSTGNGLCNAVSDQMIVTITPAPTVNAGFDQNICASSTANLNGNITVAGGAIWESSGSGNFTPNNTTLNAIYIPSASDVTAGSVTLTLRTTGNGTCNTYTDDVVITIQNIPFANAGDDQTICADSFNIHLTGGIANAGGGIWTSTGSGNFYPSATTLNADYIPSSADRASGNITLTLTTTGNDPCSAASDQMQLTILPAPTINAGTDQTICADSAFINLNGSFTVSSGIEWTSSGSGAFSPNNTTANAQYIPSANDRLAGTVTLTLTTTGNGLCQAVSDNIVLTITPAPTVSAGADQTICANSPSVDLNGSSTVAGGVIWTTSGTGGFSPDNTSSSPTYFITSADTSAGSVTFTLTTTSNGNCKAVSDQITIEFDPIPVVEAGPNRTVCANAGGVSINGSVLNALGGSWTGTGTGTFAPNANSPLATYIPSAADTAAGSVTLTLTSSGSGTCPSLNDQMTITLEPVPVVNAGPDQVICADAGAVQLGGTILHAAGGTWTTNGSGNFSPAAADLNALYYTSNADTASGSVIFTLTSSAGICSSVSDNMIVTITPAPTVDAGPDISVCTGLQVVGVNIQGKITVASGATWSSSGTGTFSDPTSLNTIYYPTVDDEAAGSVTLTLTTTGNGSCNFYTDEMILSFAFPVAVINAGNDTTVCSNGFPIQLKGSGTTGRWSGGLGTYSPNDSTLNAKYTPHPTEVGGSVILTLTAIGMGDCTPATDQVTLTLQNGPTANANTDQVICTNSTSVTLNGSVTLASGGTWTTTGSGTFADASVLNTTYTPSAADKTAGSVTFTLTTTGNGICGASTDKMIVTINPGPTIDAGHDQVVCSNTSVDLHATFTNSAGMQWSGGAGTFSPSATDPNAVYSPTPAEIALGTMILTASTTGNGVCPPATDDQVIIQFTPAPTADAGNDQLVCASVPDVTVSGSVTVASGGFWQSSGTGTFITSPSLLTTRYRPSAADTAAGSVTLTLSTTGNGTCNAVSDNVIITFSPLPVVNAGPNDTICSGDPGVVLNGSVLHAGGGIWSVATGGTFSPDATSLNTTYNQSTLDNINGSVNITLTSTGNGICPAVSDYVTIRILTSPIAMVNAGLDKTICADAVSVQLDGYIAMAAGGIWTTTGTGSFTPNNTNLNGFYVPSDDDKTNGSVIITLTSTGSGMCNAVSDDMLLTITPTPTVTSGSPPNDTICADASSVQLNGSVVDATGGIWSTTGTGYFSPDASNLNAVYVPSLTDKANGSVGLTLTSTGHGTCIPVSDDFLVTITPAPTANAGTDITVCATAPSINLNGMVTVATGGTWSTSGSGVFTNPNALNTVYNRTPADTSSHQITLTLTTTGNGLCNAVSDQVSIYFEPIPLVYAGPDQTLCSDNTAIPLNGIVQNTNGVWSTLGSGNFSDVYSLSSSYTPSAADTASGSVTLVLSTYGPNVCNPVRDSITLSLTPAPVVNAGSATICEVTQGSQLSGSVYHAGTGVWSTSGSGYFSLYPDTLNAVYYPSAADVSAGSVTLTLTSKDNGLCSAVSHSTTLVIEPLPFANAGPDEYICRGSQTTLAAATGDDINYTWSTITGTLISSDPTATITASTDTVFVLTVTDSKNCSNRDTVQVNIYDLPDFNLLPDHCLSNSLIIDSDPQNLPPVPGVFQWFRNNIILTKEDKPLISPLETGVYTITYSYGNCAYSENTNVHHPPVLSHQDHIVCENSTLSVSMQSNVSGANYVWSTGESGVDLNSISITVVLDTSFYTATVTDGNNCSSTDSVRVIGIPVPDLNLSDTITSCEGTVVVLDAKPLNIHILNPYNPIFTWYKKPTLLTNTNDTLQVNISGYYKVNLTVGQCSAQDSSLVNFTPLPVTTLPPDAKFCKETENYIILDAGAGAGYSYQWTPSAGTPIDSNTTQTIGVRHEGTYAVTITDSMGCQITDSLFVMDVCPPRVFVPTAFIPGTPGPDGKFQVFGAYYINYKMLIFNRWGEVIFISQDPNDSWDGTYRGVMMPAGVYPWVVTYEGEDPALRGPYRKEGAVTLVR